LNTKLDLVGIRDREAEESMKALGKSATEIWVLNFDNFLTETSFTPVMGRMLKTLENKYMNPVDIEFTINFNQKDEIRVNLLQCRPLQTIGHNIDVEMPDQIAHERIMIRTEGNFMGGNVSLPVSCVIFVDPENYTALSLSEKYSVARLIGKLNKRLVDRKKLPTFLLGPGRWGTHSPAMGVPVTFSEINNIAAIAEISYQDGSLIPDLSFGTHFFQDLVETNIFYLAVYPENPKVIFNREWFCQLPNMLETESPADARFGDVVKVGDTRDKGLIILSNVVTQQMICYLSY
jgi:hypothetical protein